MLEAATVSKSLFKGEGRIVIVGVVCISESGASLSFARNVPSEDVTVSVMLDGIHTASAGS
jgi:hypothetical protein